MGVTMMETIIVIVSVAFNLILKKVTPLTNLAVVTVQGHCFCNFNAFLGMTLYSHQSEVISITDQIIFQNGKKLQSVQQEQ